MELILTIDIGTSSLRIMLWDFEGKVHFTSQKEYSMEFNGFHVEQDPRTWINALNLCFEDLKRFFFLDGNQKVVGVSVTSQRASVIPVDANFKPLLKAIMWQDKRSLKQCDEIQNTLGQELIYAKTGLRIDPYFSLPKILWVKETQPEIFNSLYKFVGVQDFVINYLTGECLTDWTQASRTMLMNIERFQWDDEILQAFDIKRRNLCDLVPPGTVITKLRDEVAELSGLEKNTPVIIAGGDQQNAALALNVFSKGKAEANTGTGSFILAYSDIPVFDRSMRSLCSASAVPGKWVVEAGVFTTGSIYRWFKEQFFDWAKENAYEILNREVEETPPGSNGVVVLPHFEGSAAPYWNPVARGIIFNLNLGTKRGDIARAILEGIAFELSSNLKIIEDNIGGEGIDSVSIAGGISKLEIFNQIQADAFNKKVIKYKNIEASSLGAAISASIALNLYKSFDEAFEKMGQTVDKVYYPDNENSKLYKKLIDRKNLLYQSLNNGKVYESFAHIE